MLLLLVLRLGRHLPLDVVSRLGSVGLACKVKGAGYKLPLFKVINLFLEWILLF